jgi:ribosome-binding factor A
MTNDKKPSNRIQKLNSLVQQELGPIIAPYLEGETGLITVTKVEISGDLKWAKVWVSILGGNDERIFEVLKNNVYDIQGELNRLLPTKVLPRLQFFLDTSSRYAARINEVINEIHEEES